MSATRDYYEVLGINRSASEDEIRSAYRQLARKYHPDVNDSPEAATRFAEIGQAYEVLSDSEKRQNYDRFGHTGGGPGSAPGGWNTGAGPDVDVGSIFEEIFGGRGAPFGARPGHSGFGGHPGQQAPRPSRGQDRQHTVTVSFMTAALGRTEHLRMTGEGKSEQIDVRIPAGIESGSRMRVRGKGGPGSAGGAAGDLMLTVKVGNHPWFRRDGLDLLIDIPITIAEAAIGTTVTVPLLNGHADLTIPPGTSSGRKLRISGQGITAADGTVGDFLAQIQIVAPDSLTDAGQDAIERLAAELPNPRRSGPWSDPV